MPEHVEELACKGRSFAAVELAQCEDGLYRFALDYMTSHCGGCGPITRHGTGFTTLQAAKEAGIAAMLARWPTASPSDPDSVTAELAELRQQIAAGQAVPLEPVLDRLRSSIAHMQADAKKAMPPKV